jgi:hypothetical protein
VKKLLYTIAFSFVISLVFAQEESSFRMEVSNDSILLGNYFEVKFILENESGSQFDPPSFDGFTVVRGPSQASNFSIMNGKTSQSLSFSYYLEPLDIGNYYIDPASINVGDKILETLPKEILVVVNPDEVYQPPSINKMEDPNPLNDQAPKSTKSKKKRKVYKL